MKECKFEIRDGRLVKKSNGEAIPEDEPVFILRARDYLAIRILQRYQLLCQSDGCTDYQMEGIEGAIRMFENFRAEHPERMKQPGITKGA